MHAGENAMKFTTLGELTAHHAAATPAKPKPTRKPGLRDTLRGLRGPQ